MASSEPESTQSKSSKLPPGMVMGPDGKPCKVCTAFRNWTPPTKNTSQTHDPTLSTTAKAAGATLASVAQSRVNCPPDSEALGNATWTFLHTTAAYFPSKPTPTQRVSMLSLIQSLPILYPCWHCASDFGDAIKASPPDVRSREALSKWMCERHNEVNVKLGKAEFDCAKTDERWKDGPSDGRCG